MLPIASVFGAGVVRATSIDATAVVAVAIFNSSSTAATLATVVAHRFGPRLRQRAQCGNHVRRLQDVIYSLCLLAARAHRAREETFAREGGVEQGFEHVCFAATILLVFWEAWSGKKKGVRKTYAHQ